MITKFKLLCLLTTALAILALQSRAEINNNQPPFSLTLAQLEQWTPESKWADKANIAKVQLQPRFIASLDGNNNFTQVKARVLIAPDGMNNLGNYLNEQPKFNLYNFTHWSHIDVLNWFAGTANETVSLPAKPWVETAHRHGVKVIGTVYLSVAQYGGEVATVERLLQQDAQGRFPMADKLVAIASYYGFDGWLINPETDLTRVKNAEGQVLKDQFEFQNAARLGQKMQQFMRYLTAIAAKGMEIHWYDSMLMDGSVKWQNQLNQQNLPFFQQNAERYSDAVFVNYWWRDDMVKSSAKLAKQVNRSPYELYFGADLSPERNAQRIFQRSDWLSWLFTDNGQQALTSLALFGNEVNYSFNGNDHTPALSHFKSDKMDYRRFYAAETRLFSGMDGNLAQQDPEGQWMGIGQFVPPKSSLTQLPFTTSFNTGHGLIKATQGQSIHQEWHDVGQQDVLPTWQFSVIGTDQLEVFYDFQQAFNGGSSLAVHSDSAVRQAAVPLYQTRFLLTEQSELAISFKHQVLTNRLSVSLKMADGRQLEYPLVVASKQWTTLAFDLSQFQGQTVSQIAIKISDHLSGPLSTNIGQISIR